jgi:hypothetical protein
MEGIIKRNKNLDAKEVDTRRSAERETKRIILLNLKPNTEGMVYILVCLSPSLSGKSQKTSNIKKIKNRKNELVNN